MKNKKFMHISNVKNFRIWTPFSSKIAKQHLWPIKYIKINTWQKTTLKLNENEKVHFF